MALTPGTRLGVYEVTAPIGEGEMGQVYRATDTTLKRQVAIKILPPSLAADPDRLARFAVSEAKRLRERRDELPLAGRTGITCLGPSSTRRQGSTVHVP